MEKETVIKVAPAKIDASPAVTAPEANRRGIWILGLLLIFAFVTFDFSVLAAAGPADEAKEDVVFLVNGDRITGKIVKLEDGVLYLKSQMAGELQVPWANVERLDASTVLAVVMADDTGYQGIIGKETGDSGRLTVRTDGETRSLDISEVAVVESPDKPPIDRFDGGVNFGVTLLKAKETRQFSLGVNGSYTADTYYAEADYSTFYTTDNKSGKVYRDYFNTSYQRTIMGGWFFTGMFNTARNDSLDLDLRYNITGALGRDLVANDTLTLQALAGAGYVSEEYSNGTEYSDLEVLLGLKIKAFELESPKLSLTGAALFYPRPENLDLYRIETRTTLNLMLVKNIFWGLTFFDTYYSEPPFEGAISNDYGLISSLGVSW